MLSVVGVLPAALVAWTCYLETHYPLWDQPAADTNLTKCGSILNFLQPQLASIY